LVAVLALAISPHPEASARGFGAARGGYVAGGRGGVAYGGYRGGAAYGGYRGGAAYRSPGGYSAAGYRGGAVSGGYRAGATYRPYGGSAAGAARGGTYVGPRGTTVQAGRVGGVATGPYGGVHAGGAQGVRVTTPGGRTYTSGSRAGASVGPYGGVRAGGAHGAAAVGPYGAAYSGYRGGVAVNPYGGVRAGGVAVGHATRYVGPAALRTQAGYVRGGYHYSAFTTGWYRGRPGVWAPVRWRVPSIWLAPAWTAVAPFCGIAAVPIVYDYGSTVVINNDNVYLDGQQIATAQDYANQALQFADQGRVASPSREEDWQPLGVFGLIQGEEKMAQNIFQLGINKAGIIRGNYYDAVADNTLPVYGSLDPKSQRVAWSIGDKKTVVFEAGLNNLTQPQTPVLVHYGPERTVQMTLVRLEQPAEGKK
jgi:hypothetical protein